MAKTGAERVEAHRQRRKAEIEDLRAENHRLRAELAATVPPLPAQGEPPAPKPQRKVSATNRRQGQLTEAINSVEALKDDLQGDLDGWGDSFAGSNRYERFTAAVGELEGIADSLEAVNVSW